jgi:hypothetical protein
MTLPRIYSGRIYHKDLEWLEQEHGIVLGWLTTYYFLQTGEWVRGSKHVGSYQICNTAGRVLHKYEHMQFSRSRDNKFYLETYD